MVAAPICIPNNSSRKFPFLHILNCICPHLSFWWELLSHSNRCEVISHYISFSFCLHTGFYLFIFNWRIIALQSRGSFCCTTWISCKQACVPCLDPPSLRVPILPLWVTTEQRAELLVYTAASCPLLFYTHSTPPTLSFSCSVHSPSSTSASLFLPCK